MHPLPSLGLAAGFALAVSLAPARPATAPPDEAPATAEASCKPTGPLEVRFEPVRELGGGLVELELEVQARLDLSSVEWRLEMPYDTSLVEGRRSARAELRRGERLRERLTVRRSGPADGRGVTAVVRGVFRGSDASGATFEEPVVVQRSVRWGSPPPVGPVTTYTDPLTGETVRMVELPARRREGR